jgi:cell division septation protein DedD
MHRTEIQSKRVRGVWSLREIAPAIVIVMMTVVGSGCGTTEETEETLPPAPKPAAKDESPPKVVFESRTDTIAVDHLNLPEKATPGGQRSAIRFMVQIGAFKDPHLATAVQTTARQRYHLPVLNDYNLKFGLYQIRIGFFETYESASVFKARMQREFPGEYKDSWVVQLKR